MSLLRLLLPRMEPYNKAAADTESSLQRKHRHHRLEDPERVRQAANPSSDTVIIDMEGLLAHQDELEARERIEGPERLRQLGEQREANDRAQVEALAQAEAAADTESSLKRKPMEEHAEAAAADADVELNLKRKQRKQIEEAEAGRRREAGARLERIESEARAAREVGIARITSRGSPRDARITSRGSPRDAPHQDQSRSPPPRSRIKEEAVEKRQKSSHISL